MEALNFTLQVWHNNPAKPNFWLSRHSTLSGCSQNGHLKRVANFARFLTGLGCCLLRLPIVHNHRANAFLTTRLMYRRSLS